MTFFKTLWEKLKDLIKTILYVFIVLFLAFFIMKLLFNVQMPSFSWWSSTFLSDNYSKSIITEVEASGRNIRSVQFIDAFGRVCASVYSSDSSGFDCDYPPAERMNWTIEDYRKLLKK